MEFEGANDFLFRHGRELMPYFDVMIWRHPPRTRLYSNAKGLEESGKQGACRWDYFSKESLDNVKE
ncbi:hypothetical protein GALMADRAFT_248537 [Galerina marginata CBS 339.88]|uniref:Uncharacterized protein n=1 Tax=Galerina marginata (strain CBS 339.88) TaxID=685588 RepID=A0A067T9Y8_GALM3|nr:hypothetical protein GALMADRAFT_248537 [Galerina marginata CBS 339.88]